jgi:type III pantothenate kinase
LLLAIDVGNTNTVFALYEERELRGQWRLSTRRNRTADEYAAALTQLMSLAGLGRTVVDAAIMTSVVPEAVMPIRWMCADVFATKVRVIGDDITLEIPVRIDNPREVGSDRLVNAVGAHARYPGAVIVVDFGTATNFDIVDAEGGFCGGIIAPGVNLSLEALHQAAAKLPRVAIERPESVIGRSTVGAMRSGVYWGYVGLIEGIVARTKAEFGEPMTVVATGGLAVLFDEATDVIELVDRDLTMTGLLEIHQQERHAHE